MRVGEAEKLARGHTAHDWHNWHQNQSCPFCRNKCAEPRCVKVMGLFSFYIMISEMCHDLEWVHLSIAMCRDHQMMYLFILKTRGRKLYWAHEKQGWRHVEACFKWNESSLSVNLRLCLLVLHSIFANYFHMSHFIYFPHFWMRKLRSSTWNNESTFTQQIVLWVGWPANGTVLCFVSRLKGDVWSVYFWAKTQTQRFSLCLTVLSQHENHHHHDGV